MTELDTAGDPDDTRTHPVGPDGSPARSADTGGAAGKGRTTVISTSDRPVPVPGPAPLEGSRPPTAQVPPPAGPPPGDGGLFGSGYGARPPVPSQGHPYGLGIDVLRTLEPADLARPAKAGR